MRVSRAEVQAGQLKPRTLALALRELSDAGFVVLEKVLDRALVDAARTAFRSHFDQHCQKPEVRQHIDLGKKYVGMHVPFAPPFSDVSLCANPLAAQVMRAAMGDDLVCSFYHSNTTLPGSSEFQTIHIDMPSLLFPGFPVALPPWLMVVNIPLIDFTPENGGTEVWPGTHLNSDERALAERHSAIPSVRVTARAGDLVIRDLRLWHRGAPNLTTDIRTMLAIVYNRPWFHMPPPALQIPRAIWDGMSDSARRIFRENNIVG